MSVDTVPDTGVAEVPKAKQTPSQSLCSQKGQTGVNNDINTRAAKVLKNKGRGLRHGAVVREGLSKGHA